jgi:hypothetical protein
MAMPDRKYPLIWTGWLLAVAVSFAVIEGLAMASGGTTLSRYVWEVSLAWPPLLVLYGMVVGGLAVHFWWHWSPPGSTSEG